MPKRRARGDGSVYQRKSDGLYVGSYELGWVGGVRKRGTVSAKTEAGARRKLNAKRAEYAATGTVTDAQMTVEKWLQYWLEHIAAQRNRPGTMRSYRSIVTKHLIPGLGRRRLDQLQPQHVRELLRSLERETGTHKALSPAMVLKVHRLLAKTLRDAQREGVVTRNVADRDHVEPPRQTGGKDRGSYSIEQARTLLLSMAAHPDASRWAAALLLGPRPGEVLGLTIDRVDLDNAQVTIDRQLQRIPYRHGCGTGSGTTWPCGHRFAGDCPKRRLDIPRGFPVEVLDGGLALTPPKSRAGERVAPLPPILVELFRAQIARQAGRANPHGLMWTRDDGRPVDAKEDRKAWAELIEAAGLPPLDLYAARHTAVTLFLDAGTDVKVVGQLIGHTDPKTTRGYQHVSPAVTRAAVEQHSGRLTQSEPSGSDSVEK